MRPTQSEVETIDTELRRTLVVEWKERLKYPSAGLRTVEAVHSHLREIYVPNREYGAIGRLPPLRSTTPKHHPTHPGDMNCLDKAARGPDGYGGQ
ncbi:hypothetical protein EVAR_88669_1 [Eumeta japonica]|uniref:Uncharacterized protein n=1 Tax=Eumeta variegata TaxID=151549 RepID=A0A4C1YA76_EUMVA|nr:hypothetical protein EVAR_88669_1 [Eumeta japonica]